MISSEVWRQALTLVPASGDSGILAASTLSDLAVDITITAVSSAITFFIERQGADGNWYAVWNSGSQAGAGAVSASIGAGLTTSVSFGHNIRLRWTGAATFSASILGK